MARNREFLAVQTAGLRPQQILLMAMRLPILCVCIVLVAQEYIPDAMHVWAKTLGHEDAVTSRDFWYQDGREHWFMSGIGDDAANVTYARRYQYDDTQTLKRITYYEEGFYHDENSTSWLAFARVEKAISSERTIIKTLYGIDGASGHSRVPLGLSPKVLRMAMKPRDYLSLSEHSALASRPEISASLARRHQFLFWYALMMPLITVAFILLAFAMTIHHHARSDTLLPVLIGAFLGMFFAFSNNLVFSAGLTFDWYAWLCALMPVSLVLAGGMFLLGKHILLRRLVYN
jgi:lipopolysaccharide export LptBFGC system permease protein LptF